MPDEEHLLTLTLQRIFAVAPLRVPRALMSRAKFRSAPNFLKDELVYTLNTWLHGLPGERIQVYKRWPRDWWQALKERWFPGWAIRRWPVEYEEIDIDKQQYLAVCPHIDEPNPPRGQCVRFFADHLPSQPDSLEEGPRG